MWSLFGLGLCAVLAGAVSGESFPGPANPDLFEQWITQWRDWRQQTLADLNYSDAAYRDPATTWTQTSFIQAQMMVHDRFFYDPVLEQYTVDRYLDDVVQRFGGLDSVLVWTPYPNIGLDDRTQFDMTRDLPGGVAGVRAMISAFRARGVRVMIPFNPWDTGTKPRQPPTPIEQALVGMVNELEADGVNGDTMNGGLRTFAEEMARVGRSFAWEPELEMPEPEIDIALMSWGYWDWSPHVPPVSKWKFMEIRHLTHLCARWEHERTPQLQLAWFNAVGYNAWENVWGIWNEISERDAQEIKLVATMLRSLGWISGNTSTEWTPHSPSVGDRQTVFGSQFDHPHATLWTLINRDKQNPAIGVVRSDCKEDDRVYDCYHGVAIPLEGVCQEGNLTVSVSLDEWGYGCVLRLKDGYTWEGLSPLLNQMKQLSALPLSNYTAAFRFAPQSIIETTYPHQYISVSKRTTHPTPPTSNLQYQQIVFPASNSYNFTVEGLEIEPDPKWPDARASLAGTYVDVQYPWESRAMRTHQHVLSVPRFKIDRYPVTNEQYFTFLQNSGYTPKNPTSTNFLRHWNWTLVEDAEKELPFYSASQAKEPVVWVDLTDARAYCKFNRGRLPNEWEWQYSAEWPDGRSYPWGSTFQPNCVPPTSNSSTMPPPPHVDAVTCTSNGGVSAMVGHVWEWTNEFGDFHTRGGVVKGGSFYYPIPDQPWYFPNTVSVKKHGKVLLMHPSLDRSGGIGFRCAYEAPEDPTPKSKAGLITAIILVALCACGVLFVIVRNKFSIRSETTPLLRE